jgi:hypothetical protein
LNFLRVLSDEVLALLDVLDEVSLAGLDELLLVFVELAELVDLLSAGWAQGDLGGEELDALGLEQWGVDEGWLDDGLTLEGLEEGAGEAGAGLGHGQGGRAGAVLGLDDLVTAELDSVDEGVSGLAGDAWVVRLGEQWDDGDAGVATDDGHWLLGWVSVLDLGDEAGGSEDVEGGDAEETLGVVDALGLEHLGDNWDGRVDWVGDDAHHGLWAVVGDRLGEVSDNGRIGVEQVVTGHAWLSRDARWDDDHLGTLQGVLNALLWGVALDDRVGVDVGDVGSNAWSALEVVQRQVSHVLVELQQKRQRLANAAGGTKNCNLGRIGSSAREGSLGESGSKSGTGSKHHLGSIDSCVKEKGCSAVLITSSQPSAHGPVSQSQSLRQYRPPGPARHPVYPTSPEPQLFRAMRGFSPQTPWVGFADS